MSSAFKQERQACSLIKYLVGEHPNLVTFYHDAEDSQHETNARVFEYCNCGDLRRLLTGCKTEDGLLRVKLCGVQLALHSNNIVHRDLALRNLFVHRHTNGELTVKIGDFGLSVYIGDTQPSEKKKNSIREAPEVDDYHEYDEKSVCNSDIGCC